MKGKTKKARQNDGKEKAPGNAAGGKPGPEEETASLNDRLLRLQADFENFRRRTLREKNELYRHANEDILEELLAVLDNMDVALEGAANHGADPVVLDGFRLVSEQMLAVLAKFGLTPVDSEGEAFDPNLHEAVSHLPSDDVADGFVMAQTRRGYRLGDKLLRAAQVVVSSGPGRGDGEGTTEHGPAEPEAGSDIEQRRE